MIPSLGRIVHLTLRADQAQEINTRRGFSGNVGNRASEGQVFPLIITRIGDTEQSAVNGQVLLDGNDTLWVTSVVQGDETGQWFEPPRVTAPEPDVQASTDAEPYPVAADDPVPVEPPAWSEPADAPLPAEPAGEASPDPAPAEPDTVAATPTDESAPTA